MDQWLPFFVAVTAIAVVLQMGILLGMFLQFRKMNEKLVRVTEDFRNKMEPILIRLRILTEDSHPRIQNIVNNAEEISNVAKNQALNADRVLNEALDRLRLQIVRADQVLTGAIEAVEETGGEIRRSVLRPVQQATAFVKGVQAGIEFLRSRRSPSSSSSSTSERVRETQDEGLFI